MTDAHAKAIRETQASIPTIRTGTVTTDYGDPNTGTYVSLDNDPTSTPVRAVTGQFLAAGTRVLMASYPPRGLAIIEVLTERAPVGGDWQFFTTGAAQPFPQSLVPAGTTAIRFLLQGGGGGSGGTAATAAPVAGNVGTVAASGGGAGGDMVEVTVSLDGLQFSHTPTIAGDIVWTVGGGGGAGAAGNNVGGTGGSTTLAFTRYGVLTTLTAFGGLGGSGSAASAAPLQNRGGNFSGQISGISATGAIVYPGQPGMDGILYAALANGNTPAVSTALMGWGGDGGMAPMAGRQISNPGAGRDMRNVGVPAAGHRYGGGGAGGFAISGQVATAGAAGGAGVISWQAIY